MQKGLSFRRFGSTECPRAVPTGAMKSCFPVDIGDHWARPFSVGAICAFGGVNVDTNYKNRFSKQVQNSKDIHSFVSGLREAGVDSRLWSEGIF